MVLTKSTDIRIAIRDVLKSENGRRIAISAFVGADVLKYVGNAKGLEVYCWPHPVATNPDGIRDLLNAGAAVYFVDRLHMKLFWSQHGGHVIGSPNLSNNALGGHETRGLLEVASVESDSTGIAIGDVLALIHQRGATPVTPAVLSEFEREYKYLGIETPPQNSKRRNESAPTFNAYLSLPVPVQWAYAPWT